MHFTNVAIILSTISSVMAMPAVENNLAGIATEVNARQVAGAMETQNIVQGMLNSARSSSVGKIRRRRMQEAQERSCGQTPSADCNKCMDNAVPKAIAEVMVCGVAALAGGALSGGTASVLAATGFLACDGVVYTSYESELISCRSYN